MSRRDDLPIAASSRTPAHRTGPTPPAALLSNSPDARALIQAFGRRWPLAVIGGLAIGAAAAAAGLFLLPPSKYTVKAMIHIASSPARIIFQTSESVPDFRSYQRTQATLAKSRKVLSAALRQPEVVGLRSIPPDGDPASWLDRELKVDFPGGAEIMTVTMVGANAGDATVLVNAVCDAYLKQIVEEERRDRVTRYDSLKTLFNKLQDELKEKRKTYRISVEDVGVTDKLSVAARQQSATQNLGQLRGEMAQMQAEIRRMERKVKVAASAAESPPAPNRSEAAAQQLAFESTVASDQELSKLRLSVKDLRRNLDNMVQTSRNENDPAIVKVRERLVSTEGFLARRLQEIRAALLRADERNRTTRQGGDPSEVGRDLAVLVEQEQTLRRQVEALESELKTSNVKTLDMNWLDDEIALTSQAARTVGAEVEALNVELTAQPRIRLIERAETPIQSDPMRRYKIGGAAGMACFGLFVGAVVFLEAGARRVGSPEDVASGLGIRLIGSIPSRPKARRIRKTGEAWERMLIESVDAARTLILHASRHEPLKVIMIASAVKGEGKTTLSCLLSASLHRAGKRTLLIDCDLRCPSIHRLLDITPGAGLCELLRGEANPDDVISSAVDAGIDFLPAGKVDGDAFQGLADGRFGLLLDELRSRYDQIVIDSAPILYVSDSSMIAQHADAVIMAVLRDVSRVPKVHAAHTRMSELGVWVLGAVVGGARMESSDTYGYQYARSIGGGGREEVG